VQGSTYYVQCQVYDFQKNYISTELNSANKFRINFATANTTLDYDVENVEEDSKILIEWPGISSNPGESSGTIAYIDDFIEAGNTAIHIYDTANTSWDLSGMDDEFTLTFDWQPLSTGFTGTIIELTNSSNLTSFSVGYNGTRFYYSINDIYKYFIAESLDITKVYIIELLADSVRIKKQV
jgi:hypothetical protein